MTFEVHVADVVLTFVGGLGLGGIIMASLYDRKYRRLRDENERLFLDAQRERFLRENGIGADPTR